MAGNNWGVGFWQAYNYAADAKARRADYAKWLQDVRDREAADKLLKAEMRTIEERSVRKNEIERDLNLMRQERSAAQGEIDKARTAGTITDEQWAQETMRLTEQHNIRITPAETEWANEVMGISTFMADEAMRLTKIGGANPYIEQVSSNLFETSNRLGAVLATGAEQRKANVDEVALMQAEQQEMGQREQANREGAMALEDRKHQNDMAEIGARQSGGGAGGGKGGKEKTPLDRLAQVAKIRKGLIDGGMSAEEADAAIEGAIAQETGQAPAPAPAEAVTPGQQRFGQVNDALERTQKALNLIDSELSRVNAPKTMADFAGDTGDPYTKPKKKDERDAEREEKRAYLENQKAKYQKILEEIKKKGESVRGDALTETLDEFDIELEGILGQPLNALTMGTAGRDF